ncbi:DUF2905 domain-containing protein [Alkaliphilus serpentinus]|uniref:DUF2905 domain-containing protein n=1 Tax=Alkaliphilus serpentinus TaxID=1482731 RepID=A0A833HML1_9FIRM|nr:DUF2905 domain-containing protein [Alkaliphilus serpentinus]KAB3527680.1 DUF2905 domain-containing protein [Alkaliphilus serpentinus]
MESIGKTIIMVGIALIALGGILMIASRLGLGKLPGDIVISKGNFTFYFPIVTSILLSLLLSLILRVFLKK